MARTNEATSHTYIKTRLVDTVKHAWIHMDSVRKKNLRLLSLETAEEVCGGLGHARLECALSEAAE